MTPAHNAAYRDRLVKRGFLRKEFWLTSEELAAINALLAQMREKSE